MNLRTQRNRTDKQMRLYIDYLPQINQDLEGMNAEFLNNQVFLLMFEVNKNRAFVSKIDKMDHDQAGEYFKDKYEIMESKMNSDGKN